MIIHICGPSGSGKTYLGNQLKKKFKNKIVVKDLDDLRDEFVKKTYDLSKSWSFESEKYQNYIDNYVNKQKKPLIFVGLNDNILGKNKKLYYNVHSQYNYYIEIDDMVVVKQKCIRFITDELKNIVNDKFAMRDLVHNNPFFVKMLIKGIKTQCGADDTVKMNNKWKKDYKKMGYKFMSRENIYDNVVKLLNKK
jgi:adenylate kinase family enzyme